MAVVYRSVRPTGRGLETSEPGAAPIRIAAEPDWSIALSLAPGPLQAVWKEWAAWPGRAVESGLDFELGRVDSPGRPAGVVAWQAVGLAARLVVEVAQLVAPLQVPELAVGVPVEVLPGRLLVFGEGPGEVSAGHQSVSEVAQVWVLE
jgi:hypothetical protein